MVIHDSLKCCRMLGRVFVRIFQLLVLIILVNGIDCGSLRFV